MTFFDRTANTCWLKAQMTTRNSSEWPLPMYHVVHTVPFAGDRIKLLCHKRRYLNHNWMQNKHEYKFVFLSKMQTNNKV